MDNKELKQLPPPLRELIVDYAIDESYMQTAANCAYWDNTFEDLRWLHERYPAMEIEQKEKPIDGSWQRFTLDQAKLLISCSRNLALALVYSKATRFTPIATDFWVVWNPGTIAKGRRDGMSFLFHGKCYIRNYRHTHKDDTHLRKKDLNRQLLAKVKRVGN